MASFITNFLHGIGSGEHIKDYRHASNLFTHDNFRLSPKTAFLYHCLIKLNRQAVGYSGMSAMLQHEPELSFMVKAVDLPRMSVDIEELNQYNRKTYNMTKVNYSPITITFHDDSANTIRDFLANYYNYYFSDGSVSHDAQHDLRDGTGLRQSYSQNGFLGTGGAWGLDSTFTHEARGQNLLDYIQIYSLSKGRASGYKLINPILSGINHGTHDASAGGTPMEHSVTVNYEAIMYDEKQVSEIVDEICDNLSTDRSYTPSTLAKFIGLCNYIKSSLLICDIHHNLESDIDEAICKECESMLLKGPGQIY